jgi:hypothetical protein
MMSNVVEYAYASIHVAGAVESIVCSQYATCAKSNSYYASQSLYRKSSSGRILSSSSFAKCTR